MEDGIAIAGTTVVDYNYFIDAYPDKGMLSNISSVQRHVGGCLPNTALSMRKLFPEIPIQAIATIGQDEAGEFIQHLLADHQIATKDLTVLPDSKTGFTNVMTIAGTGERTFFFHEGANVHFTQEMVPIDELSVSIFHLGYMFLLKRLEALNNQYGTAFAEILAKVQAKGIKTSIDLVSVDRPDYRQQAQAALPFTNYFIANEVEASLITGISPNGTDNQLSESRIKEMLKALIALGVNDLAVIHAPAGGWAMDQSGHFYHKPSVTLPAGHIKSTVGAGDAFCAGMLASLYYELPIEECLATANATAAMSLSGVDSHSAIQPYQQIDLFLKSLK